MKKIYIVTESQIDKIKEQINFSEVPIKTKAYRDIAAKQHGYGTPEYNNLIGRYRKALGDEFEIKKNQTLEAFIEWLSNKTPCGKSTGHGFTPKFINCFFEISHFDENLRGRAFREASDILFRLHKISEDYESEDKYLTGNIHLIEDFLSDIEPFGDEKKPRYKIEAKIYNKLKKAYLTYLKLTKNPSRHS